MKYLNEVVGDLLAHKLRRATKYVSPKLVIRAHLIVAGGKPDRRDPDLDIRLKIGKPNFHEREFIKDCIKAKEPFPIRKIQHAHFRVMKAKAKAKAKKSKR